MWQLDLTSVLELSAPGTWLSRLRESIFYKFSLRRYVAAILSDRVMFRAGLTYLDYKRVIALLEKEASRTGAVLHVTSALQDYIKSREIHLESRCKLGVELKNQEKKLFPAFQEYKTAVDAAMARPLRDKQMWDSFFMCAMQKSANFSVPGSGKTASVLGMYAYLRHRKQVNRILVVCPKNAFGSWVDEFVACFQNRIPLQVFQIHDPRYTTQNDRRRALQYECGSCNLILVNYEAVGGVLEQLQSLAARHTLLVFDEVHKVKRINGQYARQALGLARYAAHVVAMTGTPLPNGYLDIYNLLHILFPDEYNELFDFSVPMLRKPNGAEIKAINDKLQPFFCRTTKQELDVPQANPDKIYAIPASACENELLRILTIKYQHKKLALLARILQMETDPALLLQNMELKEFADLLEVSEDTQEVDQVDYTEEVQQLIARNRITTKFQMCVNLAETLAMQGKTAIIWCVFVASIQNLAAALKRRGIRCKCIYGEVPLEDRQLILENFRAGKFQVLLTNPHTLAESVSLHSVCHDAIYYEYSYNLVHLLQSKDRIHRLGLPQGQYTQYHFFQLQYQNRDREWSMEGEVYSRLQDKEKIMMDAIEHHQMESMPTSQEDLDAVFAGLF